MLSINYRVHCVEALALGADGALWVGTQGCNSSRLGGLARRDKDDRWQSYGKVSTLDDFGSDIVVSLALGGDGSLWVGTGAGGLVQRDKDGHWQTYTKADTQGGLPSNFIGPLALDADGSLWVGTNVGLVRLDVRSGRSNGQ